MKMKFGLAAIIATSVLSLALPVLGQESVTVNLYDVKGDPYVNITENGKTTSEVAGVYNGTSTLSGAIAGVVCDDFQDAVGVPSSWTAKAYKVSTLTSSQISELLFGGNNTNYTDIGIHGYAELAYLVNMMFTTTDKTLQGEISAAIWKITDPNLIVDATALALIEEANAYANQTEDDLSQYTNLWIYTPTALDKYQEVWGRVPEGGTALLYLLMVGGVCFAAMRFNSKNMLGSQVA